MNGKYCTESCNIEIAALQIQENILTQDKTPVLFQHNISPFKRQFHKMVKHTQTVRRQIARVKISNSSYAASTLMKAGNVIFYWVIFSTIDIYIKLLTYLEPEKNFESNLKRK